ncbi:MAG: glycosyltransferase family 4 protein [Chloroflexi bacterium]|nr:glycosyltransferase family 4 protein [Chloroflexota bacterium]
MKILAIAMSRIPAPNANGIQVMKVCQALSQLGHEVILLVPDMQPQGGTRDDLKSFYGLEKTFEVRWLKTKSRRTFTWHAIREAKKLNPDVIYSWSPQSSVFALLHRLPLIFELHEPPLGRFGPLWYRAFLRLGGKKRLVSITNALRDVLARKYGLPSSSVIAPNGIDLERYESLPSKELARRKLNFSDAPTIICTGHLYAGRGVETFLALAEKSPNVEFIWVGGRQDDVEGWREKAGEQKNVKFKGFVQQSELPLYQSAADILIAPYASQISGSSGGDSASVASPMKLFDYMAAKRPIITSDLPVIREILDEESAVFVPPDDVDAWHTAVTRLLDDENLRKKLAKNACEIVGEYTWQERQKKVLQEF